MIYTSQTLLEPLSIDKLAYSIYRAKLIWRGIHLPPLDRFVGPFEASEKHLMAKNMYESAVLDQI